MSAIILPSLLVIMSAMLRSFIAHRGGTLTIIADIGMGIPVDLTFAAFSLVLDQSLLKENWSEYYKTLMIVVLTLAVLQLGTLYRPCKGYHDDGENLKAFGMWILNALTTFGIFKYIALEVMK